ncbi:hypothetical protein VTN96DRAFT_9359 [Rasamsonia emersonii]
MAEDNNSGLISSIRAAQRLDSRGKPTVQVSVTTGKGTFTALVPSGASVGSYEAVEIRDGNPKAYGGNGVLMAVHNVQHVIGPVLIEQKFDVRKDLSKIDEFMVKLDSTHSKQKLGVNAILGVSMACARAGAAGKDVPLYEFLRQEAEMEPSYILPVPFFNVLNGGAHAGNSMAFQEFMIAPVGAEDIAQAVQVGCEVYQELKKVLARKYGPSATTIGDEGGFAPPITHPSEALDLLTTAVEAAGHTGKVKFAIDPAASEFFKSDRLYDIGFKTDRPHELFPNQLSDLYKQLLKDYPIILVEDPFSQDDWNAWAEFHRSCAVELVGDDLLATNVDRMALAKQHDACNSLLLKINQIGTISEAIMAARTASKFDWQVFVSHRSGETTDDFIADLAVGLGAGHMKAGSPCRGERVVKYNRLMDIEDELKATTKTSYYAGPKWMK